LAVYRGFETNAAIAGDGRIWSAIEAAYGRRDLFETRRRPMGAEASKASRRRRRASMPIDPDALAAIDAFEHIRGKGAAGVLRRLRSDDHVANVNDAWRQIKNCAGYNIEAGAKVVQNIIVQFRYAKLVTAAFPRFAPQVLLIKKARRDAETLARSLNRTGLRPNDIEPLLQPVFHWLDQRERALSIPPARLGLSKKFTIPSAPRLVFMRCLSGDMMDLFGAPLDEAVAALTSVVFEPTTAEQVRNARTGRRRRRSV
jgi:hypothetical protein